MTPESFAAWRAEYDAEQAALAAAAVSSAASSKKSGNVDERCKFTGRQLFEQRGSTLILEEAGGQGGEGDADEDDEDFMTMRAKDDDQEEGDASGAAGGEGDADEELLGGVGDEALFDEDEDLPDE